MERAEEIIKFWFGRVEKTIVPSENRARIWFGESPEVDADIRDKFTLDLKRASSGEYAKWEKSPRGQLALIIILDQFSRHIHRDNPSAYAQDDYALGVCMKGLQDQDDHQLSLIERVFYYFPLLHSEHLTYQEMSIRSYQILVELAFPETQIIYESFSKFANHHYDVIRRFGRFPQRNVILKRNSTEEEIKFLKETEDPT